MRSVAIANAAARIQLSLRRRFAGFEALSQVREEEARRGYRILRPMKRLFTRRALAFLCLALVALTACGKSRGSADTSAARPSANWVVVPKAGGSLGKVLKEQIAKKPSGSLKPVVYVGAAWCGPCKAIKQYKGDAKMSDALAGAYIVEVDLDDWNTADFAGLGYNVTSVPVFIAVDDNAKAIGPSIDGGAWGDNIPANMAPPLKKFVASIQR
jgi:hypothetical protein